MILQKSVRLPEVVLVYIVVALSVVPLGTLRHCTGQALDWGLRLRFGPFLFRFFLGVWVNRRPAGSAVVWAEACPRAVGRSGSCTTCLDRRLDPVLR